MKRNFDRYDFKKTHHSFAGRRRFGVVEIDCEEALAHVQRFVRSSSGFESVSESPLPTGVMTAVKDS
jgi:hypothetical protein